MEKKMKRLLKSAALFLVMIGLPYVSDAAHLYTEGIQPIPGERPENSLTLPGDMIMVGNAVQDGVEAMLHLKDVAAAMNEMGRDVTHHLMVIFIDQATGEPMEAGSAAVTFKPAGRETGRTVTLSEKYGYYGAALELEGPGRYQFIIDTKLADGKKRRFSLDFILK